jgi:hypothetical protein
MKLNRSGFVAQVPFIALRRFTGRFYGFAGGRIGSGRVNWRRKVHQTPEKRGSIVISYLLRMAYMDSFMCKKALQGRSFIISHWWKQTLVFLGKTRFCQHATAILNETNF